MDFAFFWGFRASRREKVNESQSQIPNRMREKRIVGLKRSKQREEERKSRKNDKVRSEVGRMFYSSNESTEERMFWRKLELLEGAGKEKDGNCTAFRHFL